jgi:hypothetical protein
MSKRLSIICSLVLGAVALLGSAVLLGAVNHPVPAGAAMQQATSGQQVVVSAPAALPEDKIVDYTFVYSEE